MNGVEVLDEHRPAGMQQPAAISRGLNSAPDEERREGIRRRNSVSRRSLALADTLSITATLLVGAALSDETPLTWAIPFAVLTLVLGLKVGGLYDRDDVLLRKNTLDEIPGLFRTSTLMVLVLWLTGGSIIEGGFSRGAVIGMWGLLFILLVGGRSIARALVSRVTPSDRCLLVGDARAAEELARKLALSSAVNAELVARLPLQPSDEGGPQEAAARLPIGLDATISQDHIHRVILAPGRIDGESLLLLVRAVRARGVSVSVLPATPPLAGSMTEIDYIHGLSLLGVRGSQFGRSSQLLKRGFDVLASSLLLILISPILVLTAVAIKLDTRGPVQFRQRRIGRYGEHFEMLKFRSMVVGADERKADLLDQNEASGLFKMERDPRVTRVGRMIRRWSLDELPQLVNVLRGEMSLVGPRPLVPDEDARIEGHYRRRHDLTPGITGPWQALGASRVPLEEMLRLDYLYVASWSLWEDITIIMRTIPYVARGRGR